MTGFFVPHVIKAPLKGAPSGPLAGLRVAVKDMYDIAGERPGVPQPHTADPVLPRRRPDDGLLDWRVTSTRVYDFVRALTRPYPGAFGRLEGRRFKVWQAALPPLGDATVAEPGKCLGPVVSPEDNACGQLVACGQGAVVLLEVEGEDGRVLRGRALSEEQWRGRTWTVES